MLLNTREHLSPRTPLFALPPVGLGTSKVETLTNYSSRLASQIGVPVGRLINGLILPCCNTGISTIKRGVKMGSAFHLANSFGSVASEWVSALENLTTVNCLDGLTFLPWRNVFEPRSGITSPIKRWCSHCFHEALQDHPVISEHLVWTLGGLQLCPIHLVPLESRCHKCGYKPYAQIHSKHLPGFCSRCMEWLGRPMPRAKVSSTDSSWKYHVWVARSCAQLLNNPELASISSSKRLQAMITTGIDYISNGNLTRFSCLLRRSKSIVGEWRQGHVIPGLEASLHISYVFQLPLESLFSGDTNAWNFSSIQELPFSVRGLDAGRKPPVRRNWAEIEKFLGEISDGKHRKISSFEEAAKTLSIDSGALRAQFPELARQVSGVCYKRRCARAVLKASQVEKAVLELAEIVAGKVLAQGHYPSRRRIQAEMLQQGFRTDRSHTSLIRRAQLRLYDSGKLDNLRQGNKAKSD